jgi:hypothetical protein
VGVARTSSMLVANPRARTSRGRADDGLVADFGLPATSSKAACAFASFLLALRPTTGVLPANVTRKEHGRVGGGLRLPGIANAPRHFSRRVLERLMRD